ncbi:transporter substrate-binding domain-containing protein [Sporosarcina sp. ANT_H38]|uniref:transporter substrate-binding domain-containing protein n=1 Tax=Sporosarcina sp. ANT_H38 TaxID=2597358 RepID=UPI0011F1D7A8|nr:transporter substrate-binding domain-containing protein [Sporosarcina sp. ANT_H38]KAA0965912.1 transporter substrate-binding domain-containing protein [Sporosarcina sp. ANT_H38]
MVKEFHLGKIIQSLLLFSVIFVLAACGTSSDTKKDSDAKISSWEGIQKKGEIVVATSGTLYPASFHDSESEELTGYEVEIMNELGKRLKLDIRYVEIGLDGMLTSLNSGQVDLAVNDIEITPEREEKFTFSDPYKYSFGTAIVRKSDHSGIESLEDLKGKKAAGAATSVYMQVGRDHGVEEVIYDNVTNDVYLRDVAIGRTDVILNDYYLQKLALEAFPEFEIMIHPDIKYHPNVQAIIMKKDNDELLKQVNTVLADMHADGTISELSKKFFGGEDVSVEQDYDFE